MRKWLKRILWGLLGLFLLVIMGMGLFIYKTVYGLPFYDDTPPELSLKHEDFTVLVFSKTNGFPHTDAIAAAKNAFQNMAAQHNWNVVISDNAAVFNKEQLPYFDVIIWNNTTGKNLTDDQRSCFKQHMENGGRFMAIHGAGDFSRHWPWYEQELIGADFSHHTMNPQFQTATMTRSCPDTFALCLDLPAEWIREDEWYVFSNNPRENGAQVIYTVDENTFDPNGNIGFFVKDKDFGMGEDHPIVWYKCLEGGGRSLYSALGHSGAYFKEETHLDLLESAILWLGDQHYPCK